MKNSAASSSLSLKHTTGATARKRTLDRILLSVLDLEAGDPLIKALSDKGCRNIDDVLSLHAYDNNGTSLVIAPAQRNLVKVLKAWNYYLLVSLGLRKVDWGDSSYVH